MTCVIIVDCLVCCVYCSEKYVHAIVIVVCIAACYVGGIYCVVEYCVLLVLQFVLVTVD